MTTANATKKLEKAGFKVKQDRNLFSASKEGVKYLIEFYKNGREDSAVCIGVRHQDDKSDSMSDYCASIFCRNITQAISLAQS